MTDTHAISSIKIGTRHRRDMGDLDALATSIREVGLLHPIVVRKDGMLIAGERRLNACVKLGWTEIPITEIDLDEIVRGEFAENAIRKDFVPSEIEAIRRAMMPVEREAARERKAANSPNAKVSHSDYGRASDKIGAFAGVSGRTVEKIAAVVDAAERAPEKFQLLLTEMDRTGKVDGAYRKLKQAQDEQRILSVGPVHGKYKTLVIDPPWDHEGLSLAGRGRPEYAVMSHQQLCDMPVMEWAEEECHLYLWTTNNFILRGGDLISAWGFDFKTVLTWVKPHFGLGSYFRSSTEHCLFAIRGTTSTRVNNVPTHFEADAGEHSAKPECFYDIVRRASYPAYGEVFQREPRDGFVNLFESKVEAAE